MDYKWLIDRAFSEDLKDVGDITGDSIFNQEVANFKLISKSIGILSGIDILKDVFHTIDKNIDISCFKSDGDTILINDKIAYINGNVASILKAERIALNFIGFLSGIASFTNLCVKESKGKIKIIDTRKTLPGYRELAKYAVRCGGGTNHRMGLYDMAMIKDNHIDAAGSITEAVKRVREKFGDTYSIEVETRNLEEVKEALDCKVDRIMLDNMTNDLMRSACELRRGDVVFEASGNITPERIYSLVETGVDEVSMGALTHSVKNFDFSLRKV